MPDETKPDDSRRLFARGLWHGDELASVSLGNGVTAPSVCQLDLSPMQLGRQADGSPSWAERMIELRDHPDFGPLRLAFLEAVVRASDIQASIKCRQQRVGGDLCRSYLERLHTGAVDGLLEGDGRASSRGRGA